ncbi:MAG: zinc-ribbon domain-containing protein [Candidatus Binatia bacterium]
MLVQCPKCRTTYKVSDELMKGSAPSFRCSRCKHTFAPQPQSAPEAAAGAEPPVTAPTARSNRDQELRLPFESKKAYAETGKNEPADSSAGGKDLASRDDANDQWSISDPEQDDENRFVLPENDPVIQSGKALDAAPDFPAYDPFFPTVKEESDDPNNILAISSYREQKASVLPFITLFGLLVIGFTLISVISYARPQASEDVIKNIPLIGASVLRNQHLKEGILIQSLRPGYQTIQGNREVFLISGVALNQNPVVVREIQLSAIAYSDEGKELEKQMIWVGNTISPKIIRGMTTEDIPHLQDLKPLKSFEIPPGDSIPFTIVFLKSAKNAKEFSCEVIAAEGEI